MIKKFIILAFFIGISNVHSQIDKGSLSKWSLNGELGVLPISSLSSKTVYSVIGQLGINYNYRHFIMLGAYGQTMFYHQNLDNLSIDDKIIDMSSIDYNSAGLSLGLRFRRWGVEIQPKLDIGYNFFVAKALDYNIDRTSFLDYRYITLNPKLYLGYAITPFTTLGMNIGYLTQYKEIKGRKMDEFNPNSINGSLFFSFFFRRYDFLPKDKKKDGSKEDEFNKELRMPY